jgi:hypothetical protein
MAIEIHLPRKYSRETLEMLRNNDGPNVVMTPGAVETTIERNTDKTNLPVTKQSVLDIFNKQVIERINSIPKFSRDYYFVDTRELDLSHDDTIHAGFVEKLGNAFLSNEYGLMAVCDYLKLSDFVDREGDITIDDLANTFTNTINKLSTLCKFNIRISRNTNDTPILDYKGFAIGKEQTINLVNFNEVKDQLVNSRDFNSVCKKWYKKILENAVKDNRSILYKYYLPDPGLKDCKYFLKELNYGRPGPANNERYPGENRIQFTALFAHSISSAYFRIPNVTRPISSIIFKVNRHGGNHRHALSIVRPMLINERNGTIVSEKHINLQRNIFFGSGDGNLRIDFDRCLINGDKHTTDLILTFEITTTGDSGDASWVYMEIDSIIYGYNSTTEFNSGEDYPRGTTTLNNPPLPTIGNEIVKVSDPNYAATFKYTVKNITRRMSDIYFKLQNEKLFLGSTSVSLELYRNGNKIGNGTIVYNTRPWSRHDGWDYSPIIRVNVSHLDVKNGDEMFIKFDRAYDRFSNNSVFKVVRILYLPFKERVSGYTSVSNNSPQVLRGEFYGDVLNHAVTDEFKQKYLDID